MTDDELLSGFEAGTLTRFSHEDHVRVAYLVIRRHGPDDALDRVLAGLRGLAKNFGTSTLFLHVTRTAAWLRIIEAAMDGARDSAELLARHPELRRRDLLDDYYGPRRLMGFRARRSFVEPDLRPLPGALGSRSS